MRFSGVQTRRKILCVFARYARVFGTFYHSFQFFPDTEAFMPPQGILTIAAFLPEEWEVRMVDENIRPAQDEDFAWADAVFVSGMHVQRKRMAWLAERAHAFGKLAVAGGPSVSARTSYHPVFDILHAGELGDATEQLIKLLDNSVERPAQQIVLTTERRTDLDDFPIPAYHLVDIHKYMILNIQWSSGCPYTCDFCDIPALYGRKPRMKSAARLIAELDVIISCNPLAGIFWVDDNLIGDKKAARELLPQIAAWQQRNNYRLRMSGQCTINLAQDREILAMLREANFTDIYFGIESPSVETLKGIDKHQNIRMPLLEAARIINSYGIQLNAGFIFGMDPDGTDTADKVSQMIREAAIPMAALSMIFALPKTALWRKLEAEGRLIPEDEVVESNVVFKLPADVVMQQWRRAVDLCYEPRAVYERFRHNLRHTYPNQKKLSLKRYKLSRRLLHTAVHSLTTIFWRIGCRSNYRREFWRLAWEMLRCGRIDYLIYMAIIGHHLICFREETLAGKTLSSPYSPATLETSPRRDLVSIR